MTNQKRYYLNRQGPGPEGVHAHRDSTWVYKTLTQYIERHLSWVISLDD